jgi:hypothetical protein
VLPVRYELDCKYCYKQPYRPPRPVSCMTTFPSTSLPYNGGITSAFLMFMPDAGSGQLNPLIDIPQAG